MLCSEQVNCVHFTKAYNTRNVFATDPDTRILYHSTQQNAFSICGPSMQVTLNIATCKHSIIQTLIARLSSNTNKC